jgi:hypothetical protein
VNTVSAVSHTGKAARAVFNMHIYYVNDMYFIVFGIIHPVKKCAGDVHGITFIPFGTAVKN